MDASFDARPRGAAAVPTFTDAETSGSAFRRRFGTAAWLLRALHGRVRARLGLHVCGIYRRRLRPGPADLPPGYQHRIFRRGDAQALLACALRPELGLTRRFVVDALRHDHACSAVLHDGEIVSFTWLSTSPTRVDDEVHVETAPTDCYSYFHYTLPAHRGLHLPRRCAPAADAEAVARGCTHGVSYIAVDNAASVRLTTSLGGRRVGWASHFKLLGRIVALHDAGVRATGFRFRAGAAHPRTAAGAAA